MSNIVHITVENPDEILNAGHSGAGAVVQVQSAPASSGAWTDDGTVPVVTNTRSYTYYDSNGDSTTWYRQRYETSGGTATSDWSDPYQVGGEGAGLICSLYDVKQALGTASSTTDDEDIIDSIRRVTALIQGYTGRWFVRRPASGTDTFVFDVPDNGYSLHIPVGIVSITQLEVASSSQPETGGTYTIVNANDYFLRPSSANRDYGWPATEIVFTNAPVGAVSMFTYGYNAVRITGALGFSAVPGDVEAVAINAVIRDHLTKGSGNADLAVVGPTGALTVLRNISPAEMATLDRYRLVPVA